jgi:hypothetical protein
MARPKYLFCILIHWNPYKKVGKTLEDHILCYHVELLHILDMIIKKYATCK